MDDTKSKQQLLEEENAKLKKKLAEANKRADDAETSAWAQSLQAEISKYDHP
ncbi:MAG TPA: hypothetical protein VLH94_00690 [Spirochaetia bacterium]|nr:hypothetical protein [Spirochaetia bacterium]